MVDKAYLGIPKLGICSPLCSVSALIVAWASYNVLLFGERHQLGLQQAVKAYVILRYTSIHEDRDNKTFRHRTRTGNLHMNPGAGSASLSEK